METNVTGFRKILKKWDKRSKSNIQDLYMRQFVIMPCFQNDILSDVTDLLHQHGEEVRLVVEEIRADSSISVHGAGVEMRIMQCFQQGKVDSCKELVMKLGELCTQENLTPTCSSIFLRICSLVNGMEEETLLQVLSLIVENYTVDFQYVDEVSERNAMHEAAIKGYSSIVILCHTHNVNKEAMDTYGRRPLHYSALYNHKSITDFLLKDNVEKSPIDYDGFDPLSLATIGGHQQIAELLLCAGANLEPRSDSNSWHLHLACRYGQIEIAKLLLQYGAKPVSDLSGVTAVHLAAKNGHANLIKLLAEFEASVNVADQWSAWTPVFYAAFQGHIDCLQQLLDAGADITIRDESGHTALYYAVLEGKSECAKRLQEAGCPDEQVYPSELKTVANGDTPDSMPLLALPPPIMPFRIYGHSYLESDESRLQITLGHSSVKLYSKKLWSLKLIIKKTPNSTSVKQTNIPQVDPMEIFSFAVQKDQNFVLEFSLFPRYGTKLLGKAVALPSILNFNDHGVAVCPILDSNLQLAGEIAFNYMMITPYPELKLGVGERLETYWKSTNVEFTPGLRAWVPSAALALPNATGNHFLPSEVQYQKEQHLTSLVVASSLAPEYVQLPIQLTKDGVPVVFGGEFVTISDISIPISQLDITSVRKISSKMNGETFASSREIHHYFCNSCLPLEEVLKVLLSINS